MLLLGIDTSAAVSVGIVAGGKIIADITRSEPRKHAELLAPAIEQALEIANTSGSNLDGIAVGTGPGPYTGLRIGLVTAETMGYALGIPVYGIPSMDALALAARDAGIDDELVTLCDARRGEVYWARYAPGLTTASVGPEVSKLSEVDVQGVVRVGRMAPELPDKTPALLDPQAINIAKLVEQRLDSDSQDFSTRPLYLRRPHVQVPTGRKRATPHG